MQSFGTLLPIWIHQELHDIPLFSSLHNISGTVKCTSPSAVMFRLAVINAGYQISSSHVNPLGLKSDAPLDVIWDIMRCWVKNHPIKEQGRDQGRAGSGKGIRTVRVGAINLVSGIEGSVMSLMFIKDNIGSWACTSEVQENKLILSVVLIENKLG